MIYKGLFWLPEAPDERVGGELTFDNKRLTLDLLGALGETVFGSGWPTHSLVLGVTTAGIPAALVDCTLRRRHWAQPGYPTQTYRPTYALMGTHFGSEEEIKFSKVRVQASNLESWFGSWPLFHSPPVNGADGHRREGVGYERVPPLEVRVGDATFLVGQNFKVDETLFEARVTYRASASFTTGSALTFAQWHEWYLQPWRNFLALASGARTRILKTEFAPEPGQQAGGMWTDQRIDLIASGFSYVTEEPVQRLPDMLITLADIREQVGDVLTQWSALHRELNYVLNLYFGARDNPALYLEQQFLSVMQALEGFHRHWFVPKYGSERKPELKGRLADLISHVSPVMDPWMSADQGDATFAKAAADLRHELSHILDTNSPQQLDSTWLAWMLAGLSWLFEACLLLAMGLPTEQVSELVQRNQRYQEVVRRAGDLRRE